MNTPIGEYKVPLLFIANHRADYYSGENDRVGEIEYVMNDNFEGIDWLINNMNYEDVKDVSIKVSDKVFVTEANFFTSSDDFEIIEEE